MKKLSFRALRACLPIGLAALSVVACGGSDESNNKSSTGGTSAGGASSNGGTSAATAGTAGKASGSGTAGGSTGGTGSGSTGTFDTGLPADKPLSSLTDAEVAQLCSKVDDFYSKGPVAAGLKDFTCAADGLVAAAFAMAATDADARAACKAAYDPCLAGPSQVTTTDKCSKPTGTCTATVSELEACANDTAKYVDQLKSVFPSCSTLTLADLMSLGGDTMAPAEPASCTTLDTKCPGAPMAPGAMM